MKQHLGEFNVQHSSVTWCYTRLLTLDIVTLYTTYNVITKITQIEKKVSRFTIIR